MKASSKGGLVAAAKGRIAAIKTLLPTRESTVDTNPVVRVRRVVERKRSTPSKHKLPDVSAHAHHTYLRRTRSAAAACTPHAHCTPSSVLIGFLVLLQYCPRKREFSESRATQARFAGRSVCLRRAVEGWEGRQQPDATCRALPLWYEIFRSSPASIIPPSPVRHLFRSFNPTL
ncbi:hypothetical protein C8R44DRAFT_736947 [Mycena epipterygia]|nr:hypothetical protein C8R44DRAFT_736947 [Mycena epipterygia]